MRWAPQQPLTCPRHCPMQAMGPSQGRVCPFRSSLGCKLQHCMAAGDGLLSCSEMSQQTTSSRNSPCFFPASCGLHLLQIMKGLRKSHNFPELPLASAVSFLRDLLL